jgi:hypothetical protein
MTDYHCPYFMLLVNRDTILGFAGFFMIKVCRNPVNPKIV